MLKPLQDISLNPDVSSFRGRDDERIKELSEKFRNGEFSMSLFAGVQVVCDPAGKEMLDCNGLTILSDGFQTVAALVGLKKEYEENLELDMPENLEPIFRDGLNVDMVSYGTYDRDMHISWQAMRHDESQNKYRPTSIWQKVDVVSRFQRRVAGGLLQISGSSFNLCNASFRQSALPLSCSVVHVRHQAETTKPSRTTCSKSMGRGRTARSSDGSAVTRTCLSKYFTCSRICGLCLTAGFSTTPIFSAQAGSVSLQVQL